MPKTLQEQWREYRDACYPKGVSAIQNREVHLAFFAGALVAFQQLEELSTTLSEDDAAKQLASLAKEAMEVCQQRSFAAKNRN